MAKSLTPFGVREEAERLIAENRVPQEVLEDIVRDYGRPQYTLMIASDGVFTHARAYEPVEEAIDAVGHAIALKRENPDAVISIIVIANFSGLRKE